jgi:hypothetical protein
MIDMDNPDKATPVDLASDAQNGLYLCPCDITPRNFKKFEDGTVVALDFHATCFLPPEFFVCRGEQVSGQLSFEGDPACPLSVIEE